MPRLLKKAGILLFAAFLFAAVLPIGRMQALAANASISFSDPSTEAGKEFSVNVKVSNPDGTLGTADLMLNYDANAIEFLEGEAASGGAGSVRIVESMDNVNTKTFTTQVKFRALTPCTTTITVADFEVYDADARMVAVDHVGTSSVKIGGTAPVSTESTEAESTEESSGESSEAAGTEEETGSEESGEPITIDVPALSVEVLDPADDVEIPYGFAETVISLNGENDVRGWLASDTPDHEYCLFYGRGEDGVECFYSYDMAQKTVQRFFESPQIQPEYDSEQVEQMYADYTDLQQKYNRRFLIMAALAILSLIFLFIIINMLIRNSADKKERDREEYYQKELERREKERAEREKKRAEAARKAAETKASEEHALAAVEKKAAEEKAISEKKALEARRAAEKAAAERAAAEKAAAARAAAEKAAVEKAAAEKAAAAKTVKKPEIPEEDELEFFDLDE